MWFGEWWNKGIDGLYLSTSITPTHRNVDGSTSHCHSFDGCCSHLPTRFWFRTLTFCHGVDRNGMIFIHMITYPFGCFFGYNFFIVHEWWCICSRRHFIISFFSLSSFATASRYVCMYRARHIVACFFFSSFGTKDTIVPGFRGIVFFRRKHETCGLCWRDRALWKLNTNWRTNIFLSK